MLRTPVFRAVLSVCRGKVFFSLSFAVSSLVPNTVLVWITLVFLLQYDDSSMMKLVFPLSCCTLPVGNGVGVDVDVAERRKALLRNMWTERIHGAKQNVEVVPGGFLF